MPQKQLQRAESLPEQGTWQPYSRDPPPWLGSPQHKDGAPRKPLTKSQSLGETQREVLKPNLSDLTFGTGDAVLGLILQGLEDRTGLCEVMVGCHVAGLARLCARTMEGLMGSWGGLQAKLAGQGWAALRVLQREPCCQSGDAWYYRVGVTFRKEQLELAAKVRGVGAAGGGCRQRGPWMGEQDGRQLGGSSSAPTSSFAKQAGAAAAEGSHTSKGAKVQG